jgi:RIO-like serine/threonine protein kinase
MSEAELAILRLFRTYRARANDMLFLNSTHSQAHTKKFANALHSLLERKLVVKERPRDAYSLTARGYEASLAAQAGE